MTKPVDLVQGTLDMLILKIVALEPAHGWAIAQRIRQISQNVLQVNQGALYPALHRLEQQAWIKSEWGESENNRRAKYYSLTKAGQKYLEAEQANWERLSCRHRLGHEHRVRLAPCFSSSGALGLMHAHA